MESLPVEHKRIVRRRGGHGDTATHKKIKLGQRNKNSIKSQMAIATGPTKRGGQQATFVLAIDRGRIKHYKKHQSGSSGNIGRDRQSSGGDRSSTNQHHAGSSKRKKVERCSSNRGGSDNHRRHGERPRGVRDRTTQKVQLTKGTKAAETANGGVTGQSLQVV